MSKNDEKYPWRTGRSCVFKNHVHLVFVTKYRRGVFDAAMLGRLNEVLQETCEQMDCELIQFGGEDDHVHLLIAAHPKWALSNLIGKLKGKSSYFLRKEFGSRLKRKLWGNHLWSPSYCVVSCGGAPLEVVREYVEQQRKPPSPRAVKKSKFEANKGKSKPAR